MNNLFKVGRNLIFENENNQLDIKIIIEGLKKSMTIKSKIILIKISIISSIIQLKHTRTTKQKRKKL